jgi:hypothetical protein
VKVKKRTNQVFGVDRFDPGLLSGVAHQTSSQNNGVWLVERQLKQANSMAVSTCVLLVK